MSPDERKAISDLLVKLFIQVRALNARIDAMQATAK